MTQPVFGVIGWKNSGKTTLIVDLIRDFTNRGFAIAVIKHAHVEFDIDYPGRDSFKMREAGARQVLLSSPRRFAMMRELRNTPEMTLPELINYAGTSDLIMVEGFKHEPYPKIEIRREGAASREPLAAALPGVVAIASDRPQDETDSLPVFQSDDVGRIVDFIIETLMLTRP